MDLFSNATGGTSGSGKTSTVRGLIGQSILQGVQFWIHDEHFPHPESLLASLGPLADLPTIKHSGKMPLESLLADVEETISRRMAQEESDTIPRVLVVDEVLETVGRVPTLLNTIRRIGIAGRKVKVYGLFAAQTWLAKDTGGSGVRDNLTSRIVHSMKKNQARTLLQDKELAEMCPQLQPGQMLFSPVNGKSEVLRVPYCTASDMQAVHRLVSNGKAVQDIDTYFQVVSHKSEPIDLDRLQTGLQKSQRCNGVAAEVAGRATSGNTGVDSLVAKALSYIEKPGNSLSKLAEECSVNKGTLSQVLKKKRSMPRSIAEKLQKVLHSRQVIDLSRMRDKRR
jgi:hypothetical protein